MDYFYSRKIMGIAVKNRETCEHFIDYEVFDALPTDELKKKYMLQLINFELIIRPPTDEKELLIEILCFKKIDGKRQSCGCCYEKTIQDLKDEFMGIFK